MKDNYRFISDEEPTDEQLETLMLDVLESVKAQAAIANAKYQLWLQNAIERVVEQKRLRKLNLERYEENEA